MHKKFIIFLLFVCITCVVDVYAVAINEICNTSSDCDYGLFCKSQPNQPTSSKTCTMCDKPDNATFTGHGSDDDENSCPWKLTCESKDIMCNEQKCGTSTPEQSPVVYNGTGNRPECTYPAANITCEANYYRNGETCESCPTTHPNSALGSTSINNCYKNCAKTVANGTATPTSESINYQDLSECTYTISCDAGYYEDNNTCKQCPYGTTSATNDNDDICRCFFAANTVIKDKNGGGGFKLPAKAYISSALAGKNCSSQQ